MEDLFFSIHNLEQQSYRDLQQLAKSLSLPSNVKKIFLIQMIHAKKFKTAVEVDNIIERVRFERQQLSQELKRSPIRKKHVQRAEVSSTSNPGSPPIIATPKRQGQIVIQTTSAPDIRQPMMKHSRPNMLRTFVRKHYYSNAKASASDRVLRSFNLKPSLLNVVKTQNDNCSFIKPSVLNAIKANSESLKEAKERILQSGKINTKLNFTTTSVNNQGTKSNIPSQLRGQLVPVTNRINIFPNVPAKRTHTLSGIYPISTQDSPTVSYKYIKSVGLRHSDGKISRINALVQRTVKEPIENRTEAKGTMTDQDLFNTTVSQTQSENIPSLQYPNMTSVSEYEPNYQRQFTDFAMSDRSQDVYKDKPVSKVYYHKKIWAEQVRSQKRLNYQGEKERLPKIQDVFSKFRDVHERDMTQPLYVHVGDEAERAPTYPLYPIKPVSSCWLESVYNIRGALPPPLQQPKTTSNTRCVYSTPLIATPVAQTSTIYINDACNITSSQLVSQPVFVQEALPPMNEYLRMPEQHHYGTRDYRIETTGDYSTSATSSLDQSNALESSTIPEMVEDAMELISQDGDYMERIEMDERVECVLCTWAGPRFTLESHIRTEHESQIFAAPAARRAFSLGSLSTRRGRTQLLQCDHVLYALTASYDQSDLFTVSLAMISPSTPKSGQLTIYNKVTGEPYTWEGEIPPFAPAPADACLKVRVSSLNLMPNSANLKLLHSELVVECPGKVVVGIPELNDIYVHVYYKIED